MLYMRLFLWLFIIYKIMRNSMFIFSIHKWFKKVKTLWIYVYLRPKFISIIFVHCKELIKELICIYINKNASRINNIVIIWIEVKEEILFTPIMVLLNILDGITYITSTYNSDDK